MSLVWKRCLKSTIRKQWMSSCRPKPVTNDCKTLIRTMNDAPVPLGNWIARYYLKERALMKCMWTGFAMLAISLVTLIKTDAVWPGQNFQYIPDFKYEDADKKPDKQEVIDVPQRKPMTEIDIGNKAKKIENILNEPSSGPFFFASFLFVIAQLTDFFF